MPSLLTVHSLAGDNSNHIPSHSIARRGDSQVWTKIQRYLAEKYMSGPKADERLARDPTAKEKKRKQATSNNTSNIVAALR
jgi:hypothetical protein